MYVSKDVVVMQRVTVGLSEFRTCPNISTPLAYVYHFPIAPLRLNLNVLYWVASSKYFK